MPSAKSSLLPAERLIVLSRDAPEGPRAGGRRRGPRGVRRRAVIDKATFENAAQYSEGFRYVLVDGTFVVRDGKVQDGVFPGQPIRAR